MKRNKRASKKRILDDIRPLLYSRGYSLSGWSRANGYNVTSVFFSLTGKMQGKRAREIRAKVENLKG
ncbi:MAG: hypothetical protein E7035_01530 [Verrucomicrobiaceae bacterium]|nr:hypothetical protein [Verrucomicrobiaceae bacterium]